MTEKDLAKLKGCHPDLIKRVAQVIDAMAELGVTMKVTDGPRTLAEQQALYAKGRDANGKIIDKSKVVTNADGVVHRSNHQVHDDGFGRAADLAFGGPSPYAETHPWPLYGMMAKQVGLEWGGSWTSIVDRPHVQLKSNDT